MKNKIAVEQINKTYTFPLPGSKSRISVKYTRPQHHEGSISVVVNGWITDENKKQYPFSGTLVKSFGTNFKDVNKDLTNSLEDANVKAGNPITDTYEFINEKIVISVPFDAMDDFFKGIKDRKNIKKPNTLNTQQKMMKNEIVKIDIKSIQRNDESLYDKLLETYENIEENPYAVVFDDGGNKVSVIFKNKSYLNIPKQFLTVYKEKKSDIENQYEDALAYYTENRESNPELISLDLINAILQYKKNKKIDIDEIDNKLLEMKMRQKNNPEKQESKKESKPENTNWIKKIFNKKV